MIHFGLTSYASTVLYCGFVLTVLLTVFWRPIVGIYFLVPLIPLQTARYYLIGLPLGQSVVDVVLLAVILGLLRQSKQVFLKTPWNVLLCVYVAFTFVSLCLGSFYLGVDLPFSPSDPRLADWKNYVTMPLILLLVAATVQNKRQMKILVLLMCVATLMLDRGFWDTVADRDFSSFSDDLRDAGGMGYAGVNGFAAYEAQFIAFLLALAAFKEKLPIKLGYYALALWSAMCLMYSLSRGGYLALAVGCLFLGVVKQRKLIVLMALLVFTWTTVLPRAVQQRILMTYDGNSQELDHSSELRVDLWNEAAGMIRANPVIGVGFGTYAYTSHVYNYKDSHNYYLKVMAETGVVGLVLILWLLGKTFWRGYSLFRIAKDPFVASLGLGLASWVVCALIANFFGDRWNFLQVNGYMWVLGGLVARGWMLEQEAKTSFIEEKGARPDSELATEVLEPEPTGVL